MVRSYEMMVIINPTVEDHSVEVKAVEELIAKLGGEVTKTDVWGKRRLAYEIDKLTEGIYAVVTMQAEPATAKELDRQLNLNEAVLRTKLMRPDAR